MRALDGMHPTLRQTPPQYLDSTTATLSPSLRGADRRDVATGTGTENNEIEVSHAAKPSGRPDHLMTRRASWIERAIGAAVSLP